MKRFQAALEEVEREDIDDGELPPNVEQWKDEGLYFCRCCGWTWPTVIPAGKLSPAMQNSPHCPNCG
jgi:hypothetical protein